MWNQRLRANFTVIDSHVFGVYIYSSFHILLLRWFLFQKPLNIIQLFSYNAITIYINFKLQTEKNTKKHKRLTVFVDNNSAILDRTESQHPVSVTVR